jgi:hypothetical protein
MEETPVEGSTSGRRHLRAGSVTVAELMKNRPARIEFVARDIAEDPFGTDDRADDRLPHTHRRRRLRSGNLAKVAGLSTAALVLCGSLAAASIIDRRRAESVQPAFTPIADIRGGDALIPTMFTIGTSVDRTLREAPALSVPTHTTASSTFDQDAVAKRVDKTAPDNPKAPVGVARDGQVVTGASSPSDVVRNFYGLLHGHPEQALDLLDDKLQVSALSHFVDSWRTTRDITLVDVRERHDGSVHATIDMAIQGDHTMRVQQLLWFTSTEPLRIRQAEVISAQRS